MSGAGLSVGDKQGSQATAWDRSQRVGLQGGDENCRGNGPAPGLTLLALFSGLEPAHAGPEPPSLVLGKDPDRVTGPSGG